jgi:putative spermidine/putrescine transport system permease protein
MDGIRRSYVEAAMSLGANETQAFWKVTLPLARSGIVVGAMLAFALSMDDVAASIFLFDARSMTLPIALISMMRSNFDLTIAAASTLILGVTVVAVVVLHLTIGIDKLVGKARTGDSP